MKVERALLALPQVEVSWSGVRDPQAGDLLALYSPPDAFKQHKAPIKFINASDAEGYLRSRAGRLPLRLVNLRRCGGGPFGVTASGRVGGAMCMQPFVCDQWSQS